MFSPCSSKAAPVSWQGRTLCPSLSFTQKPLAGSNRPRQARTPVRKGLTSPPLATGVKSTKRSRNSPVKVVEEGEEIEGQLTPRLLLTVTQGVCVHDHRWVIGELGAVRWTVEIPARESRHAVIGSETWEGHGKSSGLSPPDTWLPSEESLPGSHLHSARITAQNTAQESLNSGSSTILQQVTPEYADPPAPHSPRTQVL